MVSRIPADLLWYIEDLQDFYGILKTWRSSIVLKNMKILIAYRRPEDLLLPLEVLEVF